MEMQEALDIAAEHLRKQGKRAMSNGSCTNLDPDGRKCAVACLLTQDELALVGPKNWVGAREIMRGHGLPGVFIEALRNAHDMAYNNDFRPRLVQVARELGLKFTPWITPQEALDTVAVHLKKQRKRTWDQSARCCVNVDADGNKCALACLLTTDELDAAGGSAAIAQRILQIKGLPHDLLIDLQNAHDCARDNKFKARLKVVAEKHGLVWVHG